MIRRGRRKRQDEAGEVRRRHMEENGRDGKREDGQRGRRQKDTNQMQKDRETPHPDCSESRLTQASSWLKKKADC